MLTSGWEPIPGSKIGTGFRKRKPLGGWTYYYPKKAPGQRLQLTKPQLHKMLEGQGGYSIISAGRNEKDPREKAMPWNHPEFIARHKKLLGDLKKHGLDHVNGLGVYDGKELSVVVPHRQGVPEPTARVATTSKKVAFVRHKHPSEFEVIRHLGKKYNQDSVIHSSGGEHEVHYTTHHGGKEGQIAKGRGHNIAGDDADNYYTLTPHPDDRTGPISVPAGAKTGKPATKWSLNVDWDNLHPAEKARFKAKKLPAGKKRPVGRPAPNNVQSALSFALDH